ncbi:SdpI family protein [Cohnella candidum]|uniref:DUF1648 domain-containing protein n=1 Tax=Cohnella candidum TaxID=2674991 RepID=A0A3G3K1R9_9BACL|nr:SdpI family protein [Cohnella candidum]AYQ74111.1 DUF1648 domain-containing protein [Cohnella candidum]
MTTTTENKKIWTRRDVWLIGFNVAAFIVLFAVFNGSLPDVVGSHYNVAGEQDGTMPKWGFWLLTAVLLIGLPLLMKALQFADPRKANYAWFDGFFDLFRWALSLFMLGVFLMMIFTNLGYHIPAINILLGGLGVLWFVIGNRLGQVRSNFFFGIRTPWTLMDDNNWRLTHRFGARMWVIAGLIMFVCCWFVNAYAAAAILISCAALSAIVPMVYSYLLFARQSKKV